MQNSSVALLANGASAFDANRQFAIIHRLMRSREDGWQQICNSIYTSSRPVFNVESNALLKAAVENRTPGSALDAGMGQDRNAVFLAIKGWDVTGLDDSDEGPESARGNAAYAGVKVNAMQGSNRSFDYGTAHWDLFVITYEPFPVADEGYIQRLRNGLRPSGLLVIESFASDVTSRNRCPVDIHPAEL